jgi:hypothetical protein
MFGQDDGCLFRGQKIGYLQASAEIQAAAALSEERAAAEVAFRNRNHFNPSMT